MEPLDSVKLGLLITTLILAMGLVIIGLVILRDSIRAARLAHRIPAPTPPNPWPTPWHIYLARVLRKGLGPLRCLRIKEPLRFSMLILFACWCYGSLKFLDPDVGHWPMAFRASWANLVAGTVIALALYSLISRR